MGHSSTTETTTPSYDSKDYGTKPVGSWPPDGTRQWAMRYYTDGTWKFVTYDGWLIHSETSTTDRTLAGLIDGWMAAKYEGSK